LLLSLPQFSLADREANLARRSKERRDVKRGNKKRVREEKRLRVLLALVNSSNPQPEV
jgi:hypothetical protein